MNVALALIASIGLSLSSAVLADSNPTPVEKVSAPEIAAPTTAAIPKEEQQQLAHAMLSKGICNVEFFGEEFCSKQAVKTFKVTDTFGHQTAEQTTSAQEAGN